MASATGKIRMIRRSRREVAPPPTKHFEAYEPIYRALLSEMKSLGGDPALEALATWIAGRTRETGQLPDPESVRKQTEGICDAHTIRIPDGSPIQA